MFFGDFIKKRSGIINGLACSRFNVIRCLKNSGKFMNRFVSTFYTTVLLFLLSTNAVLANNGGVHGPNVKEGTKSFELRMNTTNSNDAKDGREQYRIHYQQAFSDKYQLRLVLQYRDFGNVEYDNAKAEFLYNYKKRGNGKYSAGLRLDIRTRRAQRPEDIALHWTHQYDFSNDFFARGIAIVDKNISSNGAGEKPTTVATRFSITKKLDRGISIGAEMFNNYGKFNNVSKTEDQQHQFGPFFLYKKESWYLYARYLSGLTRNTDDHNFQFRVGKSF